MTRRRACAVAIGVSLCASLPAQEIRLPVGDGRVTGRVTVDDTGAPLAGAEVLLQNPNLPADLAYRTHTDGGGNFDFQNVYPRDYQLTATKAGYFLRPNRASILPGRRVVVGEGQRVVNVNVSLHPGAVVSGRVVDAFGEPVDRIRVYAKRLRWASDGTRTLMSSGNEANDVTDDLGQFRVFGLEPGDYLVLASGRGIGPVPPVVDVFQNIKPGETVPTYYPGTPDIAQAQVVSLGGGQQVPVQIVLGDQRAVSVSGSVRRADGSRGGGFELGLNPASGFTSAGRYGGKVSADGTFVLRGVPPGSYQLIVFEPPTPPPSGSGQDLRWGESGATSVVVGAEDVRDLVLVTSPGATVAGTVTFEGSQPERPVQLSALPRHLRLGSPETFSDPIRADGAFQIRGVIDGSRLRSRTGGWMVKSVIVDGREIGDGPIELGGRARLSGVRVTLTDRMSGISGLAIDERKQPLGSQQVVMMRLDPAVGGERVTTFQTERDGTFLFRGLFPGSYVVGLLVDSEPGIQHSPDYQDRLRQSGRRFTIEEGGGTIRLELQPVKGL